MPSLRFFTDPASLLALAGSRRVCYLIGAYDGTQSFGDILDLLTALERVEAVPDITPVVLLDHARRHDHLTAAWLNGRSGKMPIALFCGSTAASEAGLVEVKIPPAASAALHVYGGGFLNELRGREKAELVRALEEWHWAPSPESRRWEPVITGLEMSPWVQTDEASEARRFLRSARLLSVRDPLSGAFAGEILQESAAALRRASCDDALPQLARLLRSPLEEGALERRPCGQACVVNVHLSQEPCADGVPELSHLVSAALRKLSDVAGVRLHLRLMAACGGRDAEASCYAGLAPLLERAGFEWQQVNLVSDLRLGVATIASGDAAIAMCRHVALGHLASRVPTLLLIGHDARRQGLVGLQELLDLPKECLFNLDDASPSALAMALLPLLRDEPLRSRIDTGIRRAVPECLATSTALSGEVARLIDDQLAAQDRVTADRMASLLLDAMAALSRLEGEQDRASARLAQAKLESMLRLPEYRAFRAWWRLAQRIFPPHSVRGAFYASLLRLAACLVRRRS